MATTTPKISPTPTSPQAPNISATTTEQTGIHYSSVYVRTVPGTIKCVCLVNGQFPSIALKSRKYFLKRFSHWKLSFISDIRADRIFMYTMQRIQSDRHCPVLQHSGDDCILVYGHLARAVSVPCDLCVQQNSMDENWIFLLCRCSIISHADVITCCRKGNWIIYSSCGTIIILMMLLIVLFSFLTDEFSFTIPFAVLRLCGHVRLRLWRIFEV